MGARDPELSVRAANVARRIGAATVHDLARFTEEDILTARGFGITTLREIRDKLAERGLRLGMTPAELRRRPDTQGNIVTKGQLATPPPADHDHQGDRPPDQTAS